MTTVTETKVNTQVYRVYIKASPQAIWDAITKPEWAVRYGYKASVEYDLRPGGVYRSFATEQMKEMGASDVVVEGEVLEADPPRKLVQTFRMLFEPDMAAEPLQRLTWEIEEEYGTSRLTVTHELEGAPIHAALVNGDVPQAGGGWPFILSDLKTLLESGNAFEER